MNIKSLAKDTVIYGASDFITKLIAFFTFPIIASALSAKEFGILELVYTVTMLAAMIANLGMNNVVSLFYWDVDNTSLEKEKIVSSGLFILIISTSLILGLSSVIILINPLSFANFFDPVSKLGLTLAFLIMATTQWNQYCMDITRLNFSPWKFFGISISTRIFSIVAGLVAILYLNLGVDGLLGGQAFALVLVVPFAIYSINREAKLSGINKLWIEKLFKFGYPFIFASLAYWLFSSMDRWMLAALSSVKETGIYSVAFRFSSIIFFISMAFGQSWSPVALKLKADYPKDYQKLYGKVLIYLLFIMIFAGGFLSLFASEIILLLMPKEYFASAIPLVMLSFAVVFQSTQQVTMIGISLEKKTMLFSRIAWFTAFVNMILNFLFIPTWGALGASFATALSFLILTITYFYYTQRLHPISINKSPLLFLAFSILFFLAASFLLLDDEINYRNIFIKIGILLTFGLLGIRVLHLNRIFPTIKRKITDLIK